MSRSHRPVLDALVAAAALVVAAALPVGAASAATAAAPARAPLPSAGATMPPGVLAALRSSGLPLASFGLYLRPIDASVPTLALNDEEPFLLASTAKVVTSLAALQLLGPTHRWRSEAYTTAPVSAGRTAGDLVIVGSPAGLTPAELGRWFRQMRAEGLNQVGGRIVLRQVALLHDQHPAQAAVTAAEAAPGGAPDPRTYNVGKGIVAVQPGRGERAQVTLKPRPPNVTIVNDVLMGGGCGVRVQWAEPTPAPGAPARLVVSGRWDSPCGAQDVAFVKLPGSGGAGAPAAVATPAAPPVVPTTARVASLWAEAGGRVRGGIVDADALKLPPGRPAPPVWSSQISTPLAAVVHEMNKTSNNLAARGLLLALAPGASSLPAVTLLGAQERVQGWLGEQGFRRDDIHLDIGSGQSRAERGKPRAMVQLLSNAWHRRGSGEFVGSLPIAGFDGTLVRRMRQGPATGRAFLKTGTLSDTRALAGYVMAASGRFYAVALMVTHAEAARGTPALDAVIEWLAKNG